MRVNKTQHKRTQRILYEPLTLKNYGDGEKLHYNSQVTEISMYRRCVWIVITILLLGSGLESQLSPSKKSSSLLVAQLFYI